MKKHLLMITAVAALSLMSCLSSTDYKAKGEELAKQLDELCEKQDGAAVLALEDSINAVEQEVVATGDSAAIADFRAALLDSRQRNARYITILKIEQGKDKQEVLDDLIQDALEGKVKIGAVTSSVDTVLRREAKQKKSEAK